MNTTPISGTLAEERSLAQIKMILTKPKEKILQEFDRVTEGNIPTARA